MAERKARTFDPAELRLKKDGTPYKYRIKKEKNAPKNMYAAPYNEAGVLYEPGKKQRMENRLAIQNAVAEHMKAFSAFPTAGEIADKTGLNRATVSKHMQMLDFSEWFAPMKTKMMMSSAAVLESLYKRATTGDVQAIKLWMQLAGYVEQKEVKQDTNISVTVNKQTISNPEEFKRISGALLIEDKEVEEAEYEEGYEG